jgi:hypothetical protein
MGRFGRQVRRRQTAVPAKRKFLAYPGKVLPLARRIQRQGDEPAF